MPATSEEGEEGSDVPRGPCALKVGDRWPAVPAGPLRMPERGHLRSPTWVPITPDGSGHVSVPEAPWLQVTRSFGRTPLLIPLP